VTQQSTLSALDATALTEGIKFLYAQATELLKAFRERRKRAASGGSVPGHEQVPIASSTALDGLPATSPADGTILDAEGPALISLTGALSPYAQEFVDVDPHDRQLIEQAERMRALLEALYGQRFTFTGEQREGTGARVNVKQVLGLVHQEADGPDVEEAAAGSEVPVEQHAHDVQDAAGAPHQRTRQPSRAHATGRAGRASVEDLFFLSAIRRYVRPPRFIRRQWLAAEVTERMARPGCRFVLLTAEPGAGKSGLLAQLAEDHPDWPRYLIRRDQRQPLADASARAFLLRIGFQLATAHPGLFNTDQVRIAVQQHIGELAEGGKAVAAEVDRIVSSPFYQAVIEIRQQVERAHGSVVGVHVGEWISDPRVISISDLQGMALLDPLAALQREQPSALVVVLIDALDEVTGIGNQYGDTVLDWLSAAGELPSNLRIIATSRPNPQVRAFAEKQRDHVEVLEIKADDERVGRDLRAYAQNLLALGPVTQGLAEARRSPEDFARAAVDKAHGNIGYLDAIGRAIDRAERQHEPATTIAALVALDQLPEDLQGLYGFFLHQLRTRMSQREIKVENPDTGRDALLDAWSEVYRPILEVLSVAAGPLSVEELAGLTGTLARQAELTVALDQLAYLLDDSEDHQYRLYHATLVEFLTSPVTAAQPASKDLFIDPIAAHARLAARIRSRLPVLWTDAENATETAVRRYGRDYYVLHLSQAQQWQELFDTLDRGDYGIGKVRADATGAAYLSDLALGASAAARDGLGMTAASALLPNLFRYRLLSHLLSWTADVQAPDIYAARALLGDDERALRLAKLVAEPAQRVQTLCRIAAMLLDDPSREDLERPATPGDQHIAQAVTAARTALAAAATITDEAAALDAVDEILNVWTGLLEHGQRVDDDLGARYLRLSESSLPLADRTRALINAARLASLTDMERTRQLLARVAELATRCEDKAQANLAWGQLAGVYADLQWLDDAATTAARIRDDAAWRLRLAAYVAQAYRDSGDEAAARAEVDTAVASAGAALRSETDGAGKAGDARRDLVADHVAVARAWLVVGDHEQAIAAAHHALQAAGADELPGSDGVADLIQVFRELGDDDGAGQAGQRLRDCALANHRKLHGGPTYAVYPTQAAMALADAGEIELALDIVHAMGQQELGAAAVAVVEASARAQDWDGALKVVELIRRAERETAMRFSVTFGRTRGSTSNDALAAVGRHLADAGSADRAIRLADQIHDGRLRSAVYGAAALREIKAGRSDAAHRLLDEGERPIRLAGAQSFRFEAARAGLLLLAAVREWDTAAVFAGSVDAGQPAARARVTLGRMLLEAGQLTSARRLADEMPDADERATLLTEYAKRLAAAEPATARTALAEARSLASALPPLARWGRLDAAAIALAELGDMEAAHQALQDAITAWSEVPRIQFRPTPWCRLAGDCVRVGLYERALQIARGLPATGPWAFDRAQALVEIADALLENNDRDRAVEHLEEAVEQSSLIEFPPHRSQTRAAISARFAQLGMLPRALADDLSAEEPQQVRETVAAKLGRSGQPEEALALYSGPGTPPDAVLLAVVPALLGQGRMETARQLIDSVTSPANRIPLLVRLAEEPDQDGHKRLTAALNAISLMVSDTSTMRDPDLTARVARCLHTVAGGRDLLQLIADQWRITRSATELAMRTPLAVPLVSAATACEITSALTWAEEFLKRLTISESNDNAVHN
jgi:tetratricopeptide (TPR) repeat protein